MSIASVVLSYFLVTGGTYLTTMLAARLGLENEYLAYIIQAVGGAIGGFLAARASRGSTILEPALGAALVVLSMFALGLATSERETLLLPANLKAIALTAGVSAGGGLIGAFLSEHMFGEPSDSSAPWLIYLALAAFGAGVSGTIFGAAIGQGAVGMFSVLGVCCLVVGLAAGASAQQRPLLASLIGGALGIGAFFYLGVLIFATLLGGLSPLETGIPNEVYIALGVVALGGGVVTLIGAAIGWGAGNRPAAR